MILIKHVIITTPSLPSCLIIEVGYNNKVLYFEDIQKRSGILNKT